MSQHDVIDRVKDLLPLLRERAPEAEEQRRLPDETVKELKDIGIVRLLQPKRFGGDEADPRTFYECVMLIASACGSTGWVSGVTGVHPWQIALFDDAVQHEVWDDDPDTWVSSSYMPGGRLTPADGGYRLTGRWSFSSGCDHAGWAILGVMLDRGEGASPEMWNVLIPRSDYTIEDTWHTMGLRGTGSNDVVVDDLFVPEHRTIDLMKMFSWKSPGLAVNTSPLYRLSFGTMFSNAITAAIIGMAQGVVEESFEYTKSRVSKSWGKATEDPHMLSALGRASSEIDGCRLQLLTNLETMHAKAVRGEPITLDDRGRARRDQVQGSARAIAVIDEVFDRSGAGAISDRHPMQRLWRDAHAGRHHTANSIDRSLQSYALTVLGRSPSMSSSERRSVTAEDLAEIEAIKQLKYRYIRAVDLKQWDELAATLTEDAEAAYSDGKLSFTGRDAIVAFMRDSLTDPDTITSHRVHQPEIALTGAGSATATWALDDVVISISGQVTIRGSAYYRDELVKVGGEWKIRRTGYRRIYEEMESRDRPGLTLTDTWWAQTAPAGSGGD